MRRTCDKAGIPPRGFHTLRHTYATMQQVAVRVMEELGWIE